MFKLGERLLGQPWSRISVRVDPVRINQKMYFIQGCPKFYDLFALRALARLNPELAVVSWINVKERHLSLHPLPS